MSEWSEEDSSTYREIAGIAVPRQQEMLATLVSAAPFTADDAIRIVDIGAGDGRLADVLLECFPRATLLALDGSESMRAAITARTAGVADRIQVRAFELDTLDWWDLMHASDLVVSSLCLHHLNDAKKQYLYKAIAERLTARGRAADRGPRRAHSRGEPPGGCRQLGRQRQSAGRRRQRAGTVCHLRREPVEPLPVSRSPAIARRRSSTISSG